MYSKKLIPLLILLIFQETIACLFDRICENRKKISIKSTESVDYFDNLVDICYGRIADFEVNLLFFII